MHIFRQEDIWILELELIQYANTPRKNRFQPTGRRDSSEKGLRGSTFFSQLVLNKDLHSICPVNMLLCRTSRIKSLFWLIAHPPL